MRCKCMLYRELLFAVRCFFVFFFQVSTESGAKSRVFSEFVFLGGPYVGGTLVGEGGGGSGDPCEQ